MKSYKAKYGGGSNAQSVNNSPVQSSATTPATGSNNFSQTTKAILADYAARAGKSYTTPTAPAAPPVTPAATQPTTTPVRTTAKPDKLLNEQTKAKSSVLAYGEDGKLDLGASVLNAKANKHGKAEHTQEALDRIKANKSKAEADAQRVSAITGLKVDAGEAEKAAQKVAEVAGVATKNIKGSETAKNAAANETRYKDAGFGKKLALNIGNTLENAAADYANAAIAVQKMFPGKKTGEQRSTLFKTLDDFQSAHSQNATENRQNMLSTSNWFEKLLLEIEGSTVEQIADRFTFGLGSMAARVAGASQRQAEAEGKSGKDQLKTVLIRSGVEVGTEMLSGIGGSWNGTGYGDALLNGIDKWAASKTGSELLGTWAAAFAGEAAEEMLADVFNPLFDRIFRISNGDKTFLQEVWGDGQILYDGLVGGLSGMLSGTTSAVSNRANAKAIGADVAAYKAASRIVESKKAREKFEAYTGTALSKDDNLARYQAAAILTNTESGARAAERELMTGDTNSFRQRSDLGAIILDMRDNTPGAYKELLSAAMNSGDSNVKELARKLQSGEADGTKANLGELALLMQSSDEQALKSALENYSALAGVSGTQEDLSRAAQNIVDNISLETYTDVNGIRYERESFINDYMDKNAAPREEAETAWKNLTAMNRTLFGGTEITKGADTGNGRTGKSGGDTAGRIYDLAGQRGSESARQWRDRLNPSADRAAEGEDAAPEGTGNEGYRLLDKNSYSKAQKEFTQRLEDDTFTDVSLVEGELTNSKGMPVEAITDGGKLTIRWSNDGSHTVFADHERIHRWLNLVFDNVDDRTQFILSMFYSMQADGIMYADDFSAMFDKYAEKYGEAYESMTDSNLLAAIYEEVFCDMYAGRNYNGAAGGAYQPYVRRYISETGLKDAAVAKLGAEKDRAAALARTDAEETVRKQEAERQAERDSDRASSIQFLADRYGVTAEEAEGLYNQLSNEKRDAETKKRDMEEQKRAEAAEKANRERELETAARSLGVSKSELNKALARIDAEFSKKKLRAEETAAASAPENAPVATETTEPAETAEAQTEPMAEAQSYSTDNYTVTPDGDGNVSVKIKGRSNDLIRGALVKSGLVWDNKGKSWRGKAEVGNISSALDAAYTEFANRQKAQSEKAKSGKPVIKPKAEATTPPAPAKTAEAASAETTETKAQKKPPEKKPVIPPKKAVEQKPAEVTAEAAEKPKKKPVIPPKKDTGKAPAQVTDKAENAEKTTDSAAPTAESEKARYALADTSSEKITLDMSDKDRYEVLKNKIVNIRARTDTSKLSEYQSKNGVSLEPFPKLGAAQRRKLFRKIAEEFNVFKEYSNKDIELSFSYSAGNLRESLEKQKRNYSNFAKLLSCFEETVDSAIGIEVHNRNAHGYKPDPTLNNVYVLVSAFEDGSSIVPVKLEVKEFSDKPNTLYVAIALESIKKDEVVAQGNTENSVTQYARSSEIRLADLLSNVNPKDESFTKYIPKQFFDDTTAPIKQNFTSASTSLAKNAPVLYKDKSAEFVSGGTNIDIGAGKTEWATNYLAERGVKNLPFDPYNRPESTNRATLEFLMSGNKADTATCSNVLNVIDTAEARANVILEMAKAIKPDGKAYFTVYEKSGDSNAVQTGRDSWQNARKTADYAGEIRKYFNKVTVKGKLIIAENPKSDLPKAVWETIPGKGTRFALSDRHDRLREDIRELTEAAEGDPEKLVQKVTEFANRAVRGKDGKSGRANDRPVIPPRSSVMTEAQKREQNAKIQALIDKYGMIPKGEQQNGTATNRAFPAPAKVSDKQNIRRGVRTVGESANISDDMAEQLKRLMLDEGTTYATIRDSDALRRVNAKFSRPGAYAEVKAEWAGLSSENHEPTKYDIAFGEKLIIEAANRGDTDTFLRTAADVAAMGTQAGQVVQAFRLLKKMGPVGKLYYINQSVKRLNVEFEKRLSKKGTTIVINEQLAKELLSSKAGSEAEEAALTRLIDDIAMQTPNTLFDRWNAWRHFSMLTNPRTHVRNVFGNVVMLPLRTAKDFLAAGGEVLFKVNEEQRTKNTSALLRGEKYAELRSFAKSDFAAALDQMKRDKYSPKTEILKARNVFSLKKDGSASFLDKWSRLNSTLLEVEDTVFKRSAYTSAMTQFLAARGITAAQVKADDMSSETRAVLNEARAYAMNEALKATYQDACTLANIINMDKRASKGVEIAIDAIIPYAKTPANILKRGIEYSPIGLMRGIGNMVFSVKSGKVSATEAIDRMAAGMTGTAVAGLGVLLSSLGLIRGGSKDDKESQQKKNEGYQDYSLIIGDTSYTIDWLAPFSLPLFAGVEAQRLFASDEDFAIINAMKVIAEPMLSLSMLDGVNSLFQSAKYSAENEEVFDVVAAAAQSYVSQGIPSIVAALARTADPIRRMTYIDKNKKLGTKAQQFVQSLQGKIPIAENSKVAFIDRWGNTESNGNLLARFVSNYISPTYWKKINTTIVDEEIEKLFEKTKNDSLFPKTAEKYFTFNKKRLDLTGKQYEQYASKKGKTAYAILKAVITSPAYAQMNDAQKQSVFANAYTYATEISRKAIAADYEVKAWVERADDLGIAEEAVMCEALRNYASDNKLGLNDNEIISAMSWLDSDTAGKLYISAYSASGSIDDPATTNLEYKFDGKQKARLWELYRDNFLAGWDSIGYSTNYLNGGVAERVEIVDEYSKQTRKDARAQLIAELVRDGVQPVPKKKSTNSDGIAASLFAD